MMPKMGQPPPPKRNKEADVFAWANSKGISLEEFDQIAAAVKMLYMSFRRGLFPSMGRVQQSAEESDPSDITDAWHKTAMAIVNAGARVDPWITAQMTMCEDPFYVFPSNLYDKNAAKKYKDFTETEAPRVEMMLKSQANVFLTELGLGKTVREILENPGRYQLDDLFIYCAAKANKLDDIVAEKERNAKLMLARSPYREIYGAHFKGYVDDTDSTS